MKKIYFLTVLILFLPAFVSALDLSEYPAPFVVNGIYDDSNVFIVGAAAGAEDSIGVADIIYSLQSESPNTEITPITRLDTEIAGSEQNYNLIIVSTIKENCCDRGNSPCAKTVEMFGVTCDSWKYKPGEGVIKLVRNGNKVALIVAGTTTDDTRRAAKVVLNYKDYALKGTESIVSGITINEAYINKHITEVPHPPKEEIPQEGHNLLVYGLILFLFVCFALVFLILKYKPFKKFILVKTEERKKELHKKRNLCPKCGNKLTKEDDFCPECGRKVK